MGNAQIVADLLAHPNSSLHIVAVAASGTGNRVMTSPDGITWTLRTSVAAYEQALPAVALLLFRAVVSLLLAGVLWHCFSYGYVGSL